VELNQYPNENTRAAKTNIETWGFLKKDVEFFLLEKGTKEILLQGRFTINGREFGHGGAFLRLELKDAHPEPVILYLDGNCKYVQCSDARRLRRAFPKLDIEELRWDQFSQWSRIFTFYIFEQKCIPDSTPQDRLNTVKEILSIPDEQPFIASESNADLEMSASYSAWGKKGKEASQASRKKNKRDHFTGKKRLRETIVEEEEEEEEGTLDYFKVNGRQVSPAVHAAYQNSSMRRQARALDANM
jgi:hypothetical protein